MLFSRTSLTLGLTALLVGFGLSWSYSQYGADWLARLRPPSNQTQIAALPAGSFGDLTTLASGARGQGGGGGGGIGGGGGKLAESMPVPDFVPTVYEYKYSGELPTLPSKVELLRRSPTTTRAGIADLFGHLSRDLFSDNVFNDLKVENFSVTEDREFGYTINFMPTTGSVSINKNWLRWPDPYRTCAGQQTCYDQLKLKLADLPTDTEAIELANGFVQKLGIDLSPYGAAQVDNLWRQNISTMPAQDQYIPEEVTVIYPLQIRGETVYEEWGNPLGLRISIDVRQKKPAGLWELSRQIYESSAYATASSESLAAAIRAGGRYPEGGWWSPETTVRKIEVQLSKPTNGYARFWHNDPTTGVGQEVYAPALIFPIAARPEAAEAWWQKQSVVIPLAADLLQTGVPQPLATPVTSEVTPAVDAAAAAPAAEPEPAASTATEPAPAAIEPPAAEPTKAE